MKQVLAGVIWLIVVLLGAGAYAALALRRGEPINSGYILVAALCTYAVGYRFYSKWIAARVLALNDRRATPCEVHDDGKDFVKTNKWIDFGHHFAAISGHSRRFHSIKRFVQACALLSVKGVPGKFGVVTVMVPISLHVCKATERSKL